VRTLLKAFILTTVLIASGCAVSPTSKNLLSSPEQMQQWRLEGKLAIKFNGKSQSAYFQWEHHLDDYSIRLHGPLGQGGAKLEKKHKQVSLEAEGAKHTAANAEQLMEQSLGWSFPVSDMNWWIRGLASPNTPVTSQTHDDAGNLKQLEQQGWMIHYRKHQPVGQLTLPYKLIASRDNIRITLLLKKWEL